MYKAYIHEHYGRDGKRVWARIGGLSNQEAMTIGHSLCRTLSEEDGHVLVTLDDDKTRVLSHCTLTDRVFIGMLRYRYGRYA